MQSASHHSSIPAQLSTDIFQALLAQFIQWQQTIAAAFSNHHSDLQVQQVMTDNGVFWYAFDPRNGDTVYADSDAELRIWIEQHYQES